MDSHCIKKLSLVVEIYVMCRFHLHLQNRRLMFLWNDELIFKYSLENSYLLHRVYKTLTVVLSHLCLMGDGEFSGFILTTFLD